MQYDPAATAAHADFHDTRLAILAQNLFSVIDKQQPLQ